jgi:hypothetical protein
MPYLSVCVSPNVEEVADFTVAGRLAGLSGLVTRLGFCFHGGLFRICLGVQVHRFLRRLRGGQGARFDALNGANVLCFNGYGSQRHQDHQTERNEFAEHGFDLSRVAQVTPARWTQAIVHDRTSG